MPESYPLPSSNPEALGFALKPLEHLDRLIREHIEQGRYPGAQIALARNGQLALFRTYGDARTEGSRAAASDDTLFLLFSQTKVLTSAAVWTLIEEGRLSFMDRISDHLPEFAARGKGDITLHQVMTHQGGFPPAMSAARAGPIIHGCAPRSATSRSTGPPAQDCNTTPAPRTSCRRWSSRR